MRSVSYGWSPPPGMVVRLSGRRTRPAIALAAKPSVFDQPGRRVQPLPAALRLRENTMALHGSMVEVRASDLEGVALDWAVANAKTGKVLVFPEGGHFPPEGSVSLNDDDFTLWLNDGEGDSEWWSPSTLWSQCGPLLDEHILSLRVAVEPKAGWEAVGGVKYSATAKDRDGCEKMAFGDTRMVATCRAVVEAVLGPLVSVPAELLN